MEDNPQHHYLMGMQLIEKEDIEGARHHFDRAIYLDKEYSPALAGKALVYAIDAHRQKSKGHWEVDAKKMPWTI